MPTIETPRERIIRYMIENMERDSCTFSLGYKENIDEAHKMCEEDILEFLGKDDDNHTFKIKNFELLKTFVNL